MPGTLSLAHMGTPLIHAMTIAAPASMPSPGGRLCLWLAAISLAAGCQFTQAQGAKPAPVAPAPPAASKYLTQKGGAWFMIRVGAAEGREVNKANVMQTGNVISRRLDPLHTMPVSVIPLGADMIYVEVCGLDPANLEAAKADIIKPAKLSFHLLGPDGLEGTTTAEDKSEKPGLVKLTFLDGKKPKEKSSRCLWIQKQPELSGMIVKNATPDQMPGATSYCLIVSLHAGFGEKMIEITKGNTGKPLAIVMDDEILSAPIIQAVFGADFQISGHFTELEARTLATQLVNPLENPVTIVNSGTVPLPAAAKKP